MFGYSQRISRNIIEKALHRPLPGERAQALMAPRRHAGFAPTLWAVPPRPAAVLLLLFEGEGGPHFVLIRRPDALRNHAGQIALPGGSAEPTDASLWETAVREAREELGLGDMAREIVYLGRLSAIYIATSHFQVHPFVGWLARPPSITPLPEEVAEVYIVPVGVLLDDGAKGEEMRFLRGQETTIPYYRWQGQIIWGATAMILSEFEVLLREGLAKGEGSE